jgi:hypothetical protein
VVVPQVIDLDRIHTASRRKSHRRHIRRQGISGVAVQPSYADGTTTTNTTPPPTTPPPPPPTTVEKGNNGWGNGGEDGTNKGSDNGGGVSQGGQGAGSPQSETKSDDAER